MNTYLERHKVRFLGTAHSIRIIDRDVIFTAAEATENLERLPRRRNARVNHKPVIIGSDAKNML